MIAARRQVVRGVVGFFACCALLCVLVITDARIYWGALTGVLAYQSAGEAWTGWKALVDEERALARAVRPSGPGPWRGRGNW